MSTEVIAYKHVGVDVADREEEEVTVEALCDHVRKIPRTSVAQRILTAPAERAPSSPISWPLLLQVPQK